MMIRDVNGNDAEALCAIYNHYVEATVITFEEAVVSPAEMGRRIADITARFPWLVYEESGAVAGYAYAGPWKPRSAFRHTVESSVYVADGCHGRGIGTQLYRALLTALRTTEVHSVISGIALPNPASVRLHENFGFQKTGHFHDVGRKFDQWIDVGYWELLL